MFKKNEDICSGGHPSFGDPSIHIRALKQGAQEVPALGQFQETKLSAGTHWASQRSTRVEYIGSSPSIPVLVLPQHCPSLGRRGDQPSPYTPWHL